MALNLSTLTNSATSGDVLAEALTTADFLENVPVLRNLARGSQKGGDAKQDVALNQPKALPLIDGDGYLYCPSAAPNYASVEDPIIPATADFDLFIEFIVAKFASGTGYSHILSQYQGGVNGRVHFGFFDHQKRLYFFCSGDGTNPSVNIQTDIDAIVEGQRHTARVTRVGNTFTLYLDGVLQQTATSGVATLQTVGTQIGWGSLRGLNGAIFSVTEGSNTNIDFTATNVRHGDTKFKCATGQVVTINQAGNDPATVIKKPVLRFSDAANTGLQGLFNQTITEGYFFAAFSVLGDGGESLARIFSANSTGAGDFQSGGFTLRRFELNHQIQFRWNGGALVKHNDVFNGERGDFLLESPLRDGDQNSKINNADADDGACAFSGAVSSEEFAIGSNTAGDGNAAIDLEFLALFPSSITDAQADSVRNYINNRNNVFDLKDGFGYYFYDAQNAPVGNISSGSSSWNGRIVGSDNGDSDRYLTQGTTNDAPVGDGYVVTFADNTDHLEIPSTTQAGWQVVGTSLGTFAYRVNANAVTELNLLGNLGNVSYRKAGDLYGVILLPESATGREINEAKKLLTDRGASVSATADVSNAWRGRGDIVQFDGGDMSDVTNASYAWRSNSLTSFSTKLPSVTNARGAWINCTSLESFSSELPLATAVNTTWQNCSSLTSFSTDLPSATDARDAWQGCSSLSDFRTTDIKNCSNFANAWKSCSALSSFPAGAKLGTEATGSVNFSSAWQQSGLLSFPDLDLSNGSNFTNAWFIASNMTDFSAGAKLGTNKTNVSFQNAFRATGLTSFPSLDLSSGNNFTSAFQDSSSLTTIGAGVLLGTASASVDFTSTFQGCGNLVTLPANLNLSQGDDFSSAFYNCTSLVTFPAGAFDTMGTPLNYCFLNTWDGCSALSATSVFNILSSIDTSTQSAPASGPEITIDYDGTTLSAATNSAIDSLKTKGWSIFINSVEQ